MWPLALYGSRHRKIAWITLKSIQFGVCPLRLQLVMNSNLEAVWLGDQVFSCGQTIELCTGNLQRWHVLELMFVF